MLTTLKYKVYQVMSKTVVTTAMLQDAGLTKGACTLWQEELLLDYTIEVEDKEFKVHKVVMASVSDYFKVMLTGGMVESHKDRVRLKGQNSLAVSNILQFIYTGDFGSTKASPEELLACAVYLQIPAAIVVCTNLLCDTVNTKNCFEILSIFKSYCLQDGIRTISEYIRCNDSICSKPEISSVEDLLNVVDSWGKSEWDLFLTVKQWVDADAQKRTHHLNNIMSHIRFALMTPEQLEEIKLMDIYRDSDGTWHNLLDKSEEYQKLLTHQKVVETSEQSTMRGEPSLVCLATDDDGKFAFHASTNDGWNEYETSGHEGTVGYAFEVNGFLIDSRQWQILDPRTMKWSPMASKPKSKFRCGIAIVYCNKYLYALGGFYFGRRGNTPTIFSSDHIVRYAFETNEWEEIPAKLPCESTSLGAGVINDNIYVAASCLCKKYRTRLDCYSPSTDTWCSKAPMLKPRHYDRREMNVLRLWDEEVLFYMRQGFNIQYYSPSTDQWSFFNPLSYLDTELVFNVKSSLRTRGNSLYFFNSQCEIPDSNGEYIGSGMGPETMRGACAKWTFQGQKITETTLDDFLVPEQKLGSESSYVPAVISV